MGSQSEGTDALKAAKTSASDAAMRAVNTDIPAERVGTLITVKWLSRRMIALLFMVIGVAFGAFASIVTFGLGQAFGDLIKEMPVYKQMQVFFRKIDKNYLVDLLWKTIEMAKEAFNVIITKLQHLIDLIVTWLF